jgi:hypothetical protein
MSTTATAHTDSDSAQFTDYVDSSLEIHKVGESWEFAIVSDDPEGNPPWLNRQQLHVMHTFLGEQLGLVTPTPTAPLTASKAASGAAKANRNQEGADAVLSTHTGTVEKPDLSGGADHRWDVV